MKPRHIEQRDGGWKIVVLGSVLCKLLLHLFTNAFAGYGIFRDELYYLACSHRLDFGYVDQPPLSIHLLALNRMLFGDSIFALRLLPAVAGALTVFVAGILVRRLGGGAFAVFIACLSVIAAPIYLAFNTVYSMNTFDVLLWALSAYAAVLLAHDGKPRCWMLLGLLIGLGLLNKISMIWFATGLAAAIVLTGLRKHLPTRWPYLAALLALALFSPFVIWNAVHDFAHLEFIRNASDLKYASVTPLDFIAGQFLMINPATAPVWIAGLFFLFISKSGRRYMSLGIIFVVTTLILVFNVHSKPEYLSPAYVMLFAAGAVQIERLSARRALVWLRVAIPALVAVGGIAIAPMTLPILPVESFIRYAGSIGQGPGSYEGKEVSEVHQFYADMFGWENMARTVSGVYLSLPETERSSCVVFGSNYGEAGAVEYFSSKYELPPALSSHNNYWIWGFGRGDYRTVIVIGLTREDVESSFESVEQAAVIACKYCMPYENNLPVLVCRNPRVQWSEVWDSMKHYE
ncbi:MAG: glycosyltransferase family 39 protein [Chitinivibrionia bacterium]|nr:glycosyltransferase family 39 protein [Chitinivibrionia bacterium]